MAIYAHRFESRYAYRKARHELEKAEEGLGMLDFGKMKVLVFHHDIGSPIPAPVVEAIMTDRKVRIFCCHPEDLPIGLRLRHLIPDGSGEMDTIFYDRMHTLVFGAKDDARFRNVEIDLDDLTEELLLGHISQEDIKLKGIETI